jgi:HAD superfamily hydrolase (TIGR01509 family)
MFRAVLWDVDGTLAETERDGHRVAFNLAFEHLGLPWRWDERSYGALLQVSGGRARLLHDMAQRPDAPAVPAERQALASAIHECKTRYYADLVRDRAIPLRPGVEELINECHRQGVRTAVSTTTSYTNVESLLCAHWGARWRDRLDALVCGEDVSAKKPDPEVYVQTLRALGLGPLEAVVIEDSPGGAAAAAAAGIPVVVTRSHYFSKASIDDAIAIGPGLHQRSGWQPALPDAEEGLVTLDDLRSWYVAMEPVSDFP